MEQIENLKMTLYKERWFALENVDMDKNVYRSLVDSLTRAFDDAYGKEGSKEYVNRIEKDDNLILFINQRKVPNIIKSLVHNSNYNIQVELHGRLANGEEATRLISRPFEANKCAEIIPCYNNQNFRKAA